MTPPTRGRRANRLVAPAPSAVHDEHIGDPRRSSRRRIVGAVSATVAALLTASLLTSGVWAAEVDTASDSAAAPAAPADRSPDALAAAPAESDATSSSSLSDASRDTPAASVDSAPIDPADPADLESGDAAATDGDAAEPEPVEQVSDQPATADSIHEAVTPSTELSAGVIAAGEARDFVFRTTDATSVNAYSVSDPSVHLSLIPPSGPTAWGDTSGDAVKQLTLSLQTPVSGVWILRLTNTGGEAAQASYEWGWHTTRTTVNVGVRPSQPTVDVTAGFAVDGVARRDLQPRARITDSTGGSSEAAMTLENGGYRARFGTLEPGVYLVKVWATIGDETYSRTASALVVPADSTAPMTSITTDPAKPGPSGWFTQDITATIHAVDHAPGVSRISWRLDGSAETTGYGDSIAVPVAGDGTHQLVFRAIDHQDNASDPVAATIRIDETAPSIDLRAPADGARYDIGAEVIADFECDDATSGVASCDGSLASGTPVDTSQPGDHAFTVDAIDEAGNTVSRTVSYTIAADQVPPAVEVTMPEQPPTGWYDEPVRVKLKATDAHSGMESLVVRIDGGVPVSAEGFAYSHTFTADGDHEVQVEARDRAGNTTGWTRIDVRIDGTAPRVALRSPSAGTQGAGDTGIARVEVGGELLADYTCHDEVSGIESCEGTVPSGQAIPTDAVGTFEFVVTAIDEAGNTTTQETMYEVVAAPAPQPTPGNGPTPPPADPSTAPSADGQGTLARTGFDAGPFALGAGSLALIALISGGVLLLLHHRRRSRSTGDS
ncbi:Ig-like domain repeat protein [Agromyces sp. H66]|uniref:Ig-like domain repeat protein n=1 Tax=Agromyces sp. H66 TaxID=2529859 RepID=UPI0010AADF02|nr:Ig-like domain repeat protein [Agromyces sp. H66]